jgi:nucleoside phosphorylase/tetratricopeptide (TPR) repeat protein
MIGRAQGGTGESEAVEVSIDRLPKLGADTEIFGRREETAWLEACWADRAHVATIVAPGGVGKSALVWDWLRGMQGERWRGADRVYGWSFYSQGTRDQNTSADLFVSAALGWFGDPAPDEGSPWEKGERLARRVRERRTLLVLDGVEPLQWGPGPQEGSLKDPALATLVRSLGAHNEGLCVITSRLMVREVGDFARQKCPVLDLTALAEEDGAALLRARRVKGSEEDLRAASREYGGHSLALALLGSYLEEAAEGDVRRRREIGPLEEDDRLGGHARRVMAAYEQMLGSGSAEVGILRMLGLFDRPAGEEEIAALRAPPLIQGLTDVVAGLGGKGWNKAVARLRRLGLLERAESERDRSLDAHPLVREHFGEQVRRAGVEAWREGHRRLYELLKTKPKDKPETVGEMAPLYAAVVHGCRAGKSQEALDEVWWARIQRGEEGFSIHKLGAFGSGVAVLSAFFDPPWEKLATGLSEADEAGVLNHAGFALRALGRLPEAAALIRMGLDRNIALEDWENAAKDASNLSQLLLARGELREALDQAQKSVTLADRSEDAFQRMSKRTALAAAKHAMGLQEEAAAQFEEAERMQKERQPSYPLLYSLASFLYCDLLLDEGRDAEVRERAAQTLEWVEASQWLLDIALDHLSLGRAHLLGVQRSTGGDLAQATFHLAASAYGLRRAGRQDYLPLGVLARAALHTHTRAFDLAHRDLDEALSLATRGGFRLHECDAHLGLARLAVAQGHPAEATGHLAVARRIIQETGYLRRNEELAELDALVPQGEQEKERRDAKAQMRKKAKNMGSSGTGASPHGPEPHNPHATGTPMATPHPVDLAVVIALREEFRELLGIFGAPTPCHTPDLRAYALDRGEYRCVVTFVGEMGETAAAVVADRLIAAWTPESIVVAGITGGIHKDIRAGDVFVPTQAEQALQDGKIEGGVFKPGAPAYRADFTLLGAVSGLEFDHAEAYQQWRAEARKDLATLIPSAPERQRLLDGGLVRGEPLILTEGHLATVPMVAADAAFSTTVQAHDRHVKGIEMESAAVLRVAQSRSQPVRALAIRGISDYGDARKEELDKIRDGALRKYAMRNALRLLSALLDTGSLPRRPR